jgi:outer membrane protein OmpA-like peptidoglycan-associated protein
MRSKFIKMISLLIASLILIMIFSGISLAQCDTSITIFYDDFGAGGDGTDCFSSGTAANMTLIANPRSGDLLDKIRKLLNTENNSSREPEDGQYSIICDGASSGFSKHWLWHDVLTDHTPGDVNGNMVVINDGNNNDFYKKTLRGLCGGKNYTVTFYVANLADLDVGGPGSCGVIDKLPDISASAYCAGTTIVINETSSVRMAATRDLTWVAFTLNFTLSADQTSVDIVLHDTESAGCGNDFVFDDFKVVGPVSGLPISIKKEEPCYSNLPPVEKKEPIVETPPVVPPTSKPAVVISPKEKAPIIIPPKEKASVIIPPKPKFLIVIPPKWIPPVVILSKPKPLVVIPPKPKPSLIVQPKPVKKDTASQIVAVSADFKKDISIDEIKVDQKMQLSHIYFERGKFNLLITSFPELNDLVTFMKKYPTVRIRLEGHTDNQGNLQLNLELSENRAKEVKKYLVDQGIDENRIEWIGYGGQRPTNSNANENLRVKNRRVEVVIISK